MGAQDLIQVLEAGDVDAIATTLTCMFHSRYIQGMEHGYRHKAEPISTILVPKDGLEPVVAGLKKSSPIARVPGGYGGEWHKGGRPPANPAATCAHPYERVHEAGADEFRRQPGRL